MALEQPFFADINAKTPSRGASHGHSGNRNQVREAQALTYEHDRQGGDTESHRKTIVSFGANTE